jgi:DNA-binding GntR family transcriptional regulator
MAERGGIETGNLGVKVYGDLRSALMKGRFLPGQKLTIRGLAEEFGVSLTPVREALHYLAAEGVLETESNRSARVPLMTGERIRELRDIRMTNEGLAAARAAERISPEEVTRLRGVAAEIAEARRRGEIEVDIVKLTEFQFGVYRASRMPRLIRIIENLWLQTGPYLRLLYPDYIGTVGTRRGEWRDRLCRMLAEHDADSARREIESDVGEALDYLAKLADAAAMMR